MGKTVFGQDVERKFTVQTDPLLLVYDVFALGMWDDDTKFFCMDVEGQYKLNNTFNLSLSVSFLINNIITTADYPGYDHYQRDAFQIDIEPMLIYRPFKTGLKGFFLGLHPTIGLQSIERKDKNHLYMDLGFGFAVGYKWILNNGFTIQLGSGVCKIWTMPRNSGYYLNSDLRIPLRNFDILLLDFKLGYSF
jgi:hypothetical protein